jgi:DNA polymerase-3 subunit chi
VTQVDFYHLTRSSLAAALPPLLGRTLSAGERAVILCPDAAHVAALDEALWLAANPDWLPHGTAATPHPAWQPIYLTHEAANPNGAKFLFLVAGASISDPSAFSRVFDLFDGNQEDAVAAARGRWREANAAGFTLAYWKQGEAGWQKSG